MSNIAQEIFNENITTATTITPVDYGDLPSFVKGLTLEATFTSGSGGTTVKAYIQTSINGTNWTDIACFAFATSDARRLYNLNVDTAVTSILTPTDGTLADNTSINGIIGNQLRVKYVTVGTYVNANLKIYAKLHA